MGDEENHVRTHSRRTRASPKQKTSVKTRFDDNIRFTAYFSFIFADRRQVECTRLLECKCLNADAVCGMCRFHLGRFVVDVATHSTDAIEFKQMCITMLAASVSMRKPTSSRSTNSKMRALDFASVEIARRSQHRCQLWKSPFSATPCFRYFNVGQTMVVAELFRRTTVSSSVFTSFNTFFGQRHDFQDINSGRFQPTQLKIVRTKRNARFVASTKSYQFFPFRFNEDDRTQTIIWLNQTSIIAIPTSFGCFVSS